MREPTDREAIALYLVAGIGDDLIPPPLHKEEEALMAAEEIRAVLAAQSDRAGGQLVAGWGCWDRTCTATRWARFVRRLWAGVCEHGISLHAPWCAYGDPSDAAGPRLQGKDSKHE
ncbi:MAG TPA: hypothetical protein PLE19_12865 [Planctomycetota bacterium]|nr:hypothetical protein [Planctomycetota bacterium]HRR82929.1 hypothetical protein [Planctomycetota bacterium]HRT94785.1 hypothetical protein [Planctomycetota bacterium]